MNRASIAIKTFVFVIFVVFSQSSFAGSASGVTVNELLLDRAHSEKMYVSISGTKSGSPACQTHPVWEFVLDIGDQQGMLMYTLLLSSLKDGRLVDLSGLNVCDLYSSVETLTRIEIQ